jgi:hypothetical protein
MIQLLMLSISILVAKAKGLAGSFHKKKYSPDFGNGTFSVGYMDMFFNPVITFNFLKVRHCGI